MKDKYGIVYVEGRIYSKQLETMRANSTRKSQSI